MKYRRLTTEELESLEDEFVKFLASNQVTADEWVKLKEADSNKVHDFIELFSDIVLDKVFSNIEYLQHRSRQVIRVFWMQEDKVILTGLQISDPTKDLTNPLHLQVLGNPEERIEGVKVFQTEKAYKKPRTEEIFEMIETYGCQPAPQAMFDMLAKMGPNNV